MALQGFQIGQDAALGYAGNPTIAAIAAGRGAITPDQVRGLCARSAFKYGTP